jgi:light-regulated signal transduction histidine kinase (bacteriophytochrome)
MANMSHELRTPMNAIVGFAKIVYRKARSQLDGRQLANLEKVLGSAEILMALISDILDLSKIEAGRLEAQAEPFDLRALLSTSLDTVTPMLKTGMTLEVDLEAAPASMLSEPTRVRQVVINLLSNALPGAGRSNQRHDRSSGRPRSRCRAAAAQRIGRACSSPFSRGRRRALRGHGTGAGHHPALSRPARWPLAVGLRSGHWQSLRLRAAIAGHTRCEWP